MFRIVVMGSGASLPSKETLPSCIALKCGNTYLLDCPEGVQKQLMKYKVSYYKLKAIFLTHLHADHFLGVLGIVQTLGMFGRREELFVVGPKGTKKLFETIFSLKELTPLFPVTVKEAEKEVVFEEKEFFVKAFLVKHYKSALGYVVEEKPKIKFEEEKARKAGVKGRMFSEIQEKKKLKIGGKTVELEEITFIKKGKKIVFSGDTIPCASLLKEAAEADLLIHDACFSQEHEQLAKEKMHSTTVQAAQTALKARAGKLLLTHISNRYEDRKPLLKEAKKVFENTLIAEEGMEIIV